MKKTQSIAKLLVEIGLSDKEVKVYLSLVSLGAAQVSQVALESGIARTYVYDIAEELKKKGMLSVFEHRGVRMYQAVSHAELVALVKRKSENLEALGKKLNESVSEFESLRFHAKQPTAVEFFSGHDGVLTIYERVRIDLKKVQKHFEILTVFSPDKLETTFPGWFEQKKYIDVPPFMTKRDIMCESDIILNHKQQRSHSPNTYAFKVWPKEKGEFPVDTLCWGNKIAFIELGQYPTGTIIENEALAQTFKMWFEHMWQNL